MADLCPISSMPTMEILSEYYDTRDQISTTMKLSTNSESRLASTILQSGKPNMKAGGL